VAHLTVGAVEGAPQNGAVGAGGLGWEQARLTPAGGEERGTNRRPRLEAAGGEEPLDGEAPPRKPRQREHRARPHRTALAGQTFLHDQVGGQTGGSGVVEGAPQQRGGDVEGHIPEDPMRLVRKRHPQCVALDNGDKQEAGEAPAQAFREPGVELDREDAAGRLGERRGQPAGARADLDHEIGPRNSGRGDHLGGEAGASEKVLPVSEPGAIAAISRGHGTSLCRYPFDPRVYYQTPGTSRAVVAAYAP
jgi:hypothetical protein